MVPNTNPQLLNLNQEYGILWLGPEHNLIVLEGKIDLSILYQAVLLFFLFLSPNTEHMYAFLFPVSIPDSASGKHLILYGCMVSSHRIALFHG